MQTATERRRTPVRSNSGAAASAYRSAALAAPPRVAIVIALDKVLLNVRKTTEALAVNRFDEAFSHVTQATALLRGLSQMLDVEKGGALATRLQATYHANILALLGALGKPDAVARYTKLAEGLTELRDAWRSIGDATGGASPQQ